MPPLRQTLSVLPTSLAVCRLAPAATVPAWAHGGLFTSVTRTPDELSIVCDAAALPVPLPAGVTASIGWRPLRVHGPLDLALVGVLARLLAPLAESGVSVFTIATFDTDWILVRDTQLARACAALRDAGHTVHEHLR